MPTLQDPLEDQPLDLDPLEDPLGDQSRSTQSAPFEGQRSSREGSVPLKDQRRGVGGM